MNMKTIRSILVATALAPLAIACSAAGEPTGTSGEDLMRLPGNGIGKPIGSLPLPPEPPTFPPADAMYCPKVNPQCSVSAFPYDPTADAKYKALGCTGEYHYSNGQSAGILGGIFIVCDDTPEVQTAFPYGIQSGVCDACLPDLPANEVYVVLEEFVGPNCRTGCPIGTFGTAPGGGIGLGRKGGDGHGRGDEVMSVLRACMVASIAGLVVACSAAPDEGTGSSDEAMMAVNHGGAGSVAVTPLPPLAFPPANAEYCPSDAPACTVTLDTPGEVAPEGCSDPFTYASNDGIGLVYGVLALCPDTPAIQSAYANTLFGGLCNACLPEAPAGTIYVGIDKVRRIYHVLPNCQTGCPLGGGNTVIGVGTTLGGGLSSHK